VKTLSVVERLKAAKRDLFSDENTWRSSGPPWEGNARLREEGYDMAVAQLAKILEQIGRERP
jgi:hypothetical protein